MTLTPAAAHRAQRSRTRRDPLWLDVSLLVAVAVVVCLVSLPRLRGFAVHGNERDAQATVALFGMELAEYAGEPEPTIVALLASAPQLGHRMRDVRKCEESGVLVHHGYCFSVVAGMTYAWPLDRGRTGRAAFRSGADGSLQWTANPNGHSGAGLDLKNFEADDWHSIQP
jgi:hypothetical protein